MISSHVYEQLVTICENKMIIFIYRARRSFLLHHYGTNCNRRNN